MRRALQVLCGSGLMALLGIVGFVFLGKHQGTLAGTPSRPETSARSQPGQTRFSVEVIEARRRPIDQDAEFTGSLIPRRMSRIAPQVEGIVLSIPQTGQIDVEIDGQRHREALHLRLGEFVRKGDVLVQLDPTDFEVALRMAQAKRSKAEADLDQLRSWKRPEEIERLAAIRDEAVARHQEAIKHHDRILILSQRNAASQSDLDQRFATMATTKALVESAEADLRLAQSGPTKEEIAVQTWLIAEAEAEVAQRQRSLEKATIRAPYDGVITNIQVDQGDWVSPASGPILELLEVRYLIAEIGVPESFVGKIQMQDRAKVYLAGRTDPVTGLVTAVNEKVEPQTRTFRVRVAIDNAERQFKAGQFARVVLPMSHSEESIVVPSRSLVFVEGQPHLFVYDGDEVHRKPVTLGTTTTQSTEITAGLQLGELVVVDDPVLLSDGMKVTIKSSTQIAIAPQAKTEAR